jgi:signal peptide peptidase SppA
MKIFPHLFSKLFCQRLMLTEPVRYSLESSLLQRMGLVHDGPSPRAELGDQGTPMEDWIAFQKDIDATLQTLRIERIYQTVGDVAVVTLAGVIDKHISQFEMDCYGGCDLADFDTALQQAAADPKIQRVVLNVNSPGGSVLGVPESAARVAALKQTMEVRSFVDGMCCSAAFYIASQADQLDAAPSAILGSIGVYLSSIDATRAAEMQGYKVELITAGKYKAMGSPFKPLSDDERAMLQASVDDLHADFKAAVRTGMRRGTDAGGHQTVPDSAMEGQCFDGKEALTQRLCDSLTSQNLDEYVGALLDAR